MFRGKKEISDHIEHVWNRLKTNSGGYLYEINKNYTLIQSLINDYPEIMAQLFRLMKQIEANIPLNALYVDLTADEKIENESINNEKDIIEIMKSILSGNDVNIKKSLFDKLILTEPFNNFTEELLDKWTKGEFND